MIPPPQNIFKYSSIVIYMPRAHYHPILFHIMSFFKALIRLGLLFWQRRGGFSCRPTQCSFVREDALVRSLSPGGDSLLLLYNLPGSLDETSTTISYETKQTHTERKTTTTNKQTTTKQTWWRSLSSQFRRRSLKKRAMKTRSLYLRLTWVCTLSPPLSLVVVFCLV